MTTEHAQLTMQTLAARFGAQLQEFRGQYIAYVVRENLVEALRTLRDELGYDLLSAVHGVDYWPAENPRFHVVYHVYSMRHNARVMLRVPVASKQPSVPTVEGVFASANWYEREVWDMFGIKFEGHSDLRRIVMPEDWEGHPLRKDFPLGYEEVQFTFSADEVMLGKLQPKD